MVDADLYRLNVELVPNRQHLINITGSRETVIDVALRVILDSAPAWNEYAGYRPLFSIDCYKVAR